MKIALVGNPNSGKTTLYNSLTKNNQKVGNWPGVTVEYKAGPYFMDKSIEIIDLPGIYSLSPYSPEEIVTREYLLNENIDLIINIVDATNIERSLYLSTQLTKIQIPMIIALNMSDILKDDIDLIELEKTLNIPVVLISALKESNVESLMSKAKTHRELPHDLDLFEEDVNEALQLIKSFISNQNLKHENWYAQKILENDEKVMDVVSLSNEHELQIQMLQKQFEEKYDDDINGLIINQIYNYVTDLRNKILIKKDNEISITQKIDRIVTHKYFAFPILALVMFLLYYLTVSSIGGYLTDFIEEILFPQFIAGPIETFLVSMNVSPIVQSLVLDGLIGGVGAVVTFVPQIMILFFLIALLEDVGYMSRIAFILDKVFTKFGLSGTSVIPMIVGTGCSVPGIMATRTIKDEGNRRMTIMLTPFIICSAKLPIFVLLIGVFFPNSPWILVAMYFLGILVILLSGLFLQRFEAFKSKDSTFIMELVDYKKPQLKSCIKNSLNNGLSFIKNAGTIIFVASAIVWFLSSFNIRLEFVDIENSMLQAIGSFIAPLFIPLGFGNWQSTVATLTGFLAKETVVSTFSILANATEATETVALSSYLPTIMSQAGALSMMVFTIFAAPCFAAIAATKREFKSWKWTLLTITYQTTVAYIIAFIVYNIARIFIS